MWDEVFSERRPQLPVHFTATYTDGRGTHRLEEWRVGTEHVRRLTDSRIDLHADALTKPLPGQGRDYEWQVIDREKKVEDRMSSTAMLHAGVFYSFWSMAHVVTRPAGRFRLKSVAGVAAVHVDGLSCTWFEIAPEGQAATRVCWSREIGVPLAIAQQKAIAGGESGMWLNSFRVLSADRHAPRAATFAVESRGLEVRNLDALEGED